MLVYTRMLMTADNVVWEEVAYSTVIGLAKRPAKKTIRFRSVAVVKGAMAMTEAEYAKTQS